VLEAGLVGSVLPAADLDHTMQLVLSDITVCTAPGLNETRTYPNSALLPAADRPEWLMPAGPPADPFNQAGTTPAQFCEIATATNDEGTGPPVPPYGAGDVPSLM